MKILGLSVFIIFVSIPIFSQVVNTEYGKVEGEKLTNSYRFLGIPFAKPPVGSLRWKAPLEPDDWEGILETKEFAPACPQKEFSQGDTSYVMRGDEDCLYLNIWTPKLSGSDLPVLVFIHGGGNQQGSAYTVNSGTNIYDGQNMAERGNAVVVTIQYRLGPLGYLVHPGLEEENANNKSENYAVMDHILALKWIKNNIAHFDGNNNKVMIFGESAGAVNVGNLLCTDEAKGLFQRACMESGVPVIDIYANAKINGIDYVNKYKQTGTDSEKIAYMRNLSAEEIIKYNSTPFENGLVQSDWSAVKDDVIFDDYSIIAVQNGDFNKVPVVIGSNAEEASLSSPLNVTPTMVETLITSFVPQNYREEARQLYPPGTTNTIARESYVRFLTDMQFVTNARKTAECIAANQEIPVYRYFFTYRHSIPQLEKYGSYHGMELFYVFNNWEKTQLGSGFLFKESDKSVQNNMLKYWINFAETGNPNSVGLEKWPEFKEGYDCYLDIKADPDGTKCGIRKSETDFWYKVKNNNYCSYTIDANKEIIENIDFFYPNPAFDKIYIADDFNFGSSKIEIMDVSGKILISTSENSVDISKLHSGTYFVRLYTEDRTYVKKLIIR